MTERNSELFRAVARKIDTEPAAYDQGTWGEPDDESPCGTVACIAGWAAMLTGRAELTGAWERVRFNWTLDGEPVPTDEIVSFARVSLGLDPWEANLLFNGDGAPLGELTVPEALEKLAVGTDVEEVWGSSRHYEDYDF